MGPAEAYCTTKPILSTVEWPYAVDAGLGELIGWQEGGPEPPAAAEDEYVNSKTLKRNGLGIALGGLRLPEVEVPVVLDLAENSAHAAPNPYPFSAFCTLLGQHQNFSESTLAGLYGNYGEYVEKVKGDTEKLVGEGFLLPEGAQRIVDSAEEFPRLPPTVPVLSGASTNKGAFGLGWRGPVSSFPESLVPKFNETYPTFELQHLSSAVGAEWTTVAGSLGEPGDSISSEEEGTWSYRARSKETVAAQHLEPEEEIVSPWSAVFGSVKVDRSAPLAPSVGASRVPDYAGGGGWYKGSVEVGFTSNGDPSLPDGSSGSGVNPASVPASQSFGEDGSHVACGTVEDNAGNVSAPGCLTVQVESTAPNLEVSCPAMVAIGAGGVNATVTASDSYSGLKANPSGTVPINTSTSGLKTVTETAVSNVGTEVTKSCSTFVGYYTVDSGPINGKLLVRSGEAVKLGPTATVKGNVTVRAGGALDVEGASISGALSAGKPALVRVCAASIGKALKVSSSAGPVVIGDGTPECAANTVGGAAKVTASAGGATIVGNSFGASLSVLNNMGTTTVTNNKVTGTLTVLRNSGTVTDKPNEAGKSKLQ